MSIDSVPSQQVRVFIERGARHTGSIGAGDEEECFTPEGRKVGVWLTTEVRRGEGAFVAAVDLDELLAYEVSSDGDEYRCFVVPAAALSAVSFSEA
jgi:hypothetical protein